MIDRYSFGLIAIDGKEYHSDVIIYPEEVKSNWWRKESHGLIPDDIKEVIKYKPSILIVGCGASGCLEIPETTKAFVQSKRIVLIAKDTRTACNEFNQRIEKKEKIVAALHLTC